MRAAHGHAYASRPEAHGKVISVISARCVKGNGNHIDFNTAVDGFSLFVDVNYIPAWRNPGGQIRHSNLLKVKNPRSSHGTNFRSRSGDQQKSWHSRAGVPQHQQASLQGKSPPCRSKPASDKGGATSMLVVAETVDQARGRQNSWRARAARNRT